MAKNKNQKKRNKRRTDDRFEKRSRLTLPPGSKRWILAVFMFLSAIIIALSFFDLAGAGGGFAMRSLSFLIGRTLFIVPLVFVIGGLVVLSTKYKNFLGGVFLAILILIFGISGMLGCLGSEFKEGGWIGFFISWPLTEAFGFWVAEIIFGAIVVIGGVILWHLSPPFSLKKTTQEKEEKESFVSRTIKKVRGVPKFEVKEIEPFLKGASSKVDSEVLPPDFKEKPFGEAKVMSFQPPPIDLLGSEKGLPNSGDTGTNSSIIKRTLQNFGIEVVMSEINIGPTVTQYTLKPAEGVKLSKITALSNNLSLALASHPLRIEAPIPGRALVGIEVPNKSRAFVRLRNLIQSPDFQNPSSPLTLVLGRDVAGEPVFTALSRMPHLLVAGATGTGKTIFLNSLILSLLYQPATYVSPFGGSPEIMRFILIDPKRVEFSAYNRLPHLLCPVIYDPIKTVNVLRWLVKEMERRFEVLSEAKARDISSFNSRILQEASGTKENIKGLDSEYSESMPYIVVIIDELADLMAAKGREIEAGIVRLAQMARAVGIHLVVATQRPSVEVITGLIKANITSRITFQVASQIDSRTVLDMGGAERLLGFGDMLYISADTVKPKRIQGAYIPDKEVKKVTNYINSKMDFPSTSRDLGIEKAIEGELDFKEDFGIPGTFSADSTEKDPLYEEAKRVVIEAKKASASLLQRRLRLGYARAARLIDTLEERGVVGPGEGAKPREVYLSQENKQSLENDIGEEEEGGWRKV